MTYRARRRSSYGLHVKKGRGHGAQRFGYRVGEVAADKAAAVITFEIEELDNTHILREAAKQLNCQPTLPAVLKAVETRWGPKAKAIWLGDNKKWIEERYGPGRANKVLLPENAVILSNLGDDGKLYVYSGEEDWE